MELGLALSPDSWAANEHAPSRKCLAGMLAAYLGRQPTHSFSEPQQPASRCNRLLVRIFESKQLSSSRTAFE